ncbi:hypothetical protein EIP86_011154 [Pleurotus ostreatoroseus]|nr:hypothetical protein EIP86_011154 [Pleurotus ostreatoroseus]
MAAMVKIARRKKTVSPRNTEEGNVEDDKTTPSGERSGYTGERRDGIFMYRKSRYRIAAVNISPQTWLLCIKGVHAFTRESWHPFSLTPQVGRAAVLVARTSHSFIRNKSKKAAASSSPSNDPENASATNTSQGLDSTLSPKAQSGEKAVDTKEASNGKNSNGGKAATAAGAKSDGAKGASSIEAESAETSIESLKSAAARAQEVSETVRNKPNEVDGGPEKAQTLPAEASKEQDTDGPPTSLTIDCDASVMPNNEIGVAAVLNIPGHQEILRRHFRDRDSPVPSSTDAEIIGLVLGLICLVRYMRSAPVVRPTKVTIRCDNTSAIQAADLSQQPRNEPHKLLLNRIRDFKYRFPDVELVFAHVPGHSNIPGNQRAHVEAKSAARDPLVATNERLPDTLKRMLPDAAKPEPSLWSMFKGLILSPIGIIGFAAAIFFAFPSIQSI